jgi:hypothetical protein
MLTGQREQFDVIVNFIAIKIISEIDNIFLEGISDVILIKITEPEDGEEWQPKIVYAKVPFNQRGCWNGFMFFIYKLFKIVYNSVYFYFFPFLCILLNFISRKCTETRIPVANITAQQVGFVSTYPLCEELEVFYIKKLFTMALFGNLHHEASATAQIGAH